MNSIASFLMLPKTRLAYRVFTAVTCCTTLMLVLFGFSEMGSHVLNKGSIFSFILWLSFVGTLVAGGRGYYFEYCLKTSPHLLLPPAIDAALGMICLVAGIVASTSSVMDLCGAQKSIVDPLHFHCDTLYAATVFTYLQMVVYLGSFIISFVNYKDRVSAGITSRWKLPRFADNKLFYSRLLHSVLSLLVITTAFGIYKETTIIVRPTLPVVYQFVVGTAYASIAISLFWIFKYDLESVQYTKYCNLSQLLYNANLGVFALAGAIAVAAKSAITSNCDVYDCGSAIASSILAFALAFAHFAGAFAAMKGCNDFQWVQLVKGRWNRICVAVLFLSFLAFALSLGSIKLSSTAIYGFLHVKLVLFASVLAWTSASIALLHRNSEAAKQYLAADISMGAFTFLVLFIGAIAGFTQDTCGEYVDCNVLAAGAVFCLMIALVFLAWTIISIKEWSQATISSLPSKKILGLRLFHLAIAISLLSIACSFDDALSTRPVFLMLGAGAFSVIYLLVVVYFHIRHKQLVQRYFVEIGLLSFSLISAILALTSDAMAVCRSIAPGRDIGTCAKFHSCWVLCFISATAFAVLPVSAFVHARKEKSKKFFVESDMVMTPTHCITMSGNMSFALSENIDGLGSAKYAPEFDPTQDTTLYSLASDGSVVSYDSSSFVSNGATLIMSEDSFIAGVDYAPDFLQASLDSAQVSFIAEADTPTNEEPEGEFTLPNDRFRSQVLSESESVVVVITPRDVL